MITRRVLISTGMAGLPAHRLRPPTPRRDELTCLDKDKMTEIINNKALHRYELAVEGHIAATYYSLADGVITFIHTEVPPELGGKGIGSKLIRGALDQVRAEGLKVIAQCPFVKAFIDKNAGYQDLLK
jgi:predicted GNAT family acetyltransferase